MAKDPAKTHVIPVEHPAKQPFGDAEEAIGFLTACTQHTTTEQRRETDGNDAGNQDGGADRDT